jgi:hypothetical protein
VLFFSIYHRMQTVDIVNIIGDFCVELRLLPIQTEFLR